MSLALCRFMPKTSEAMHQEQRDKTHQLLRQKGIHQALFAHPGNVTWLTGMPHPWRAAADLYAGGPSLVWYENGHFTLITMDGQAASTGKFADQPNCKLVTYLGYTYEQQPAGPQLLAKALQAIVNHTAKTPIGVETQHLPLFLYEALLADQSIPPDVVSIDDWLTPLRIIRTDEEIVKMRENFELIEVAQAVAKTAVKPGNLELDVWHAIHAAMQQAAGETLYLGNDCTVGRRMGGPALAVEILPTDSFIVDLSTSWKGYWSDSCVTYYATEPSSKQKKMHQAVSEALDLAISLAKPGAVCREIDQTVRRFLTDQGYPTYPHHTGHGIGVIAHDAPRVTPYSEEILQAGMVVMLEPGIYYPNETGIRLEHAVLIKQSGPEILSASLSPP